MKDNRLSEVHRMLGRVMTALVTMAAALIAVFLLTASAASAQDTATVTIEVWDPGYPDLEHHVLVDGVELTVTHNAPATIGLPASGLYALEARSDDPTGFDHVYCVTDSNTVIAETFYFFRGPLELSLPAGGATCRMEADRPNVIGELIVNTEAPDDPTALFNYSVEGSLFGGSFGHTDGGSTTIDIVHPETGPNVFVNLQSVSPGEDWLTQISCISGGDLVVAEASGRNPNVNWDHQYFGTVTCTMTHSLPPLTIQVNLTNVGDLRISSPNLDPGESRSYEFLADEDIELWLQRWGREALASSPGEPAVVVTGTCVGDGGRLSFSSDQGSSRFGHATLTGSLPAGATVECDIAATEYGIYPTVTCLGGNGRIDVNVLNTSQSPHRFSLTVGNLSPRVRTVAALDWWRNPITGRADGTYPATLQRAGEVIWERDLVVACDDDPTVTGAEVRVITPCRNGRNFVAWQFANPTSSARSYVIEVVDKSTGELAAPNRSTTAAAYGAAVRGASNLPNGHYTYTVRVGGAVHAIGDVLLTCDRWLELQFFERIHLEDIPGFPPYGPPDATLYIRSGGEVIGTAPHFGTFRLGHDDAATFDLDLIAQQTSYFGPLTIECEGAAAVAFDGRFLSGTVPQYSGTACTVIAEPF